MSGVAEKSVDVVIKATWPSACVTDKEGKPGGFCLHSVIIKMNMWGLGGKLEIFHKVLKLKFLKNTLIIPQFRNNPC